MAPGLGSTAATWHTRMACWIAGVSLAQPWMGRFLRCESADGTSFCLSAFQIKWKKKKNTYPHEDPHANNCAVLLIIVCNWKQSEYSSFGEWIKNGWHPYVAEHHLAKERNEPIHSYVGESPSNVVNFKSRKQNVTSHIISCCCAEWAQTSGLIVKGGIQG